MGYNQSDKNVLVAMSGGVDSSVAALIMKNAGYKVKGAILRMHDAGMSAEDLVNGKLPASIWYAREASRKLRLDFSIIDVRDDFDRIVEKYFISGFQEGVKPDSEYFSYKHLQLPQMLEAAEKLDCDKLVTGHYARIEYDEASGRYLLKKSKDREMDQSYKLARLSQEELSRVLTPLGDYEKEQIREMAEAAKLKSVRAAENLCFVPDSEYWNFVGKRLKELAGDKVPSDKIMGMVPGNFVDKTGNVLGTHKGFLYYTVGSRKNFEEGEIPEGLYVYKKNADTNEIVLAPEEELYTDIVRAASVNFVSVPEIPAEGMKVNAKIHYLQDEYPGTARILEDGILEVKFDSPVRAPIPGLNMVIYDGDAVLASGIIL